MKIIRVTNPFTKDVSIKDIKVPAKKSADICTYTAETKPFVASLKKRGYIVRLVEAEAASMKGCTKSELVEMQDDMKVDVVVKLSETNEDPQISEPDKTAEDNQNLGENPVNEKVESPEVKEDTELKQPENNNKKKADQPKAKNKVEAKSSTKA